MGYMPEHDCLPADVTATEFVTHLGRMSGLPPTAAKERAAESLRHVGLHEERYRQIGTLLHRHEAAGQAGPGAGRGPGAAAARRADQRPGPGRPRRHARAWSRGSAPNSASRSWSPRTCSVRSSGSATSWSRSRAGRLLRAGRSPASPQASRGSRSRSTRAPSPAGRPSSRAAGWPRGRSGVAARAAGGDDPYDGCATRWPTSACRWSGWSSGGTSVEELFPEPARPARGRCPGR